MGSFRLPCCLDAPLPGNIYPVSWAQISFHLMLMASKFTALVQMPAWCLKFNKSEMGLLFCLCPPNQLSFQPSSSQLRATLTPSNWSRKTPCSHSWLSSSSYTPHPNCQEILRALLSKCTRNVTFSHYFHTSLNHHYFFPGLLQ